jgi:hypothetical protein
MLFFPQRTSLFVADNHSNVSIVSITILILKCYYSCMDAVYYLFGFLATGILVALMIGFIRPVWVSRIYRRLGKETITRKLVAGTMIPALLVSGGVMGATEPASVRLEREATEAAELQIVKDAEAKKSADAEKARTAEAARKQAAEEAAARKAAEELAEQQRLAAEKAAAEEAARVNQTTQLSSPPPSPSAPSTSSSQGTVHQGAFCSPQGATGIFSSGNGAICAPASDGRNRWQLQ